MSLATLRTPGPFTLALARRLIAAPVTEPQAPLSSPCPAIEARYAALSSAGPVEVEPDSGPVSRRALDVTLAVYLMPDDTHPES